MPQMHCNFFSYSLGHGVDLTITLPGVGPCDMDDPALLTHQMPEKFPVLSRSRCTRLQTGLH